MIDIIYMHGGDVIKFAGDALLVVWRRGSEEDARRASTTYVKREKRRGEGWLEKNPPCGIHPGVSTLWYPPWGDKL